MKDDDESSDAVWFDMLRNEDYQGIMLALKSYIRAGNKYPPSIGELLKGYDNQILEFNNAVLETMERDGYFADSEVTDPEVARFNYENRKRKAMMWASRDYPKEHIPEWFLKDYKSYEERVKSLYFIDKPKRIGLT